MNAISYGDNILSSLHKTLEQALKYGETADADVDKYKRMAKRVCEIEHDFVLGQDGVKDAAKQSSIEAFDQVLEDHINEVRPSFKPQISKRYTDFAKKAQRLVDVERNDASQSTSANMSMDIDEDMAASGELIPDIDPITKQKLMRPVRNKNCNHIYGYNSVLQSLQQNSRLRCPIVGCANKKYVTMSDLIEDDDLALRLESQRRSQRD